MASLFLPAVAMASTAGPTVSTHSVADQQIEQASTEFFDQKGVGATSPAPAASAVSSQQSATQKVQQSTAPGSSPVQPPQASNPLGTAAAPDTHIDGVAASTLSGAAIAPAKQKRVWRFSIRTALVVGAIVAVGIVVGATAATSSRP
jgi:hypothetical protein